jgi:hypothetical protein
LKDYINFFFFYKKYKKKLRFKSIGFSAKIYPNALGLAATLDPRVIFIILIIILNIHDSSLSESECHTRLIILDVGLTARSCHKSMIIK